MEFASKAYFLLLLLLIPYILWYFLYRKKNEPTMRLSDTRQFAYAPKSLRQRGVHGPLRILAVLRAKVLRHHDARTHCDALTEANQQKDGRAVGSSALLPTKLPTMMESAVLYSC